MRLNSFSPVLGIMVFRAYAVRNDRSTPEVQDCSVEIGEYSPGFEECNLENGQNNIVIENFPPDIEECDLEIFEVARGIGGRFFWETYSTPVNEKHISHGIVWSNLVRTSDLSILSSTFSTILHPLPPTGYRIYSSETFLTLYADGRFRQSQTISRNCSEFLT